MNAIDEQIKLAYDGGMTPDQIAEDLCVDIAAVKNSLVQHTGFYIEAKNNADLYDDVDLQTAKENIKRLQFSDVDAVALRASLSIIEEKKGRNDIKALRDAAVPFNLFNEALRKSREARARSLNNGGSIINITPKTV